jgi:hypothetical protein
MKLYDDPTGGDGFESAPNYACERYGEQVEELLQMMNHSEAFVTDESQFLDFYSASGEEWDDVKSKLEENFDIKISLDSYVWETAEKIYEYEME